MLPDKKRTQTGQKEFRVHTGGIKGSEGLTSRTPYQCSPSGANPTGPALRPRFLVIPHYFGEIASVFSVRGVGSPKELVEYHPARHFPLSRKEPRFDSIEVILGVIESADVLITTTHDTLSTALEAANGLRSRDSDKRPNHAPVLYDKGRNCLQLSEGRLLL